MENLRCEEVFREVVSPAPHNLNQQQQLQQQAAYHQPLVCRAYKDPVILEDNRVFQNMLDIEEFYIAATNYFATTQSEIRPHMRKIVTDWMLEVCLDQNCHADVFLLSCNIMDRFLSQLNIRKSQFQLVAAASIFIASKLVDPCPIAGCDLVKYTDNTYQLTELLEMELLILSKLKWDLSAVTPYDFLEYLLRLLAEEGAGIVDSAVLRRHTENFIILCATEYRFSGYPASMLSSAALAAAATALANTTAGQQQDGCDQLIGGGGGAEDQLTAGSRQPLDTDNLVARLQILTRVENDCLHGCIQEIENTFHAARDSLAAHLQQEQKTAAVASTAATSAAGPAAKATPANSNIINNNNNKLMETDNQGSGLSGAAASADSGSSERSSQTPTEVFSVDWLYVA